MEVRKVDLEKDYDEIASWWKSQGWPVLPKEVLSSSGFIAEEAGVKLAATWMFPTNCPIYIMEWTVGNPDAPWNIRSEALRAVTDGACEWAKKDGAAQVFTMTKNDRFIDKLGEFGFNVTENGMTHLVRSL